MAHPPKYQNSLCNVAPQPQSAFVPSPYSKFKSLFVFPKQQKSIFDKKLKTFTIKINNKWIVCRSISTENKHSVSYWAGICCWRGWFCCSCSTCICCCNTRCCCTCNFFITCSCYCTCSCSCNSCSGCLIEFWFLRRLLLVSDSNTWEGEDWTKGGHKHIDYASSDTDFIELIEFWYHLLTFVILWDYDVSRKILKNSW